MDDKKQSLKILVRSPNWVGDAVMATPVPRALKGTYPACQIHVWAKSWVAPVWERHPDVDQVIALDVPGRKSLVRMCGQLGDLRKEHYDLVLILPNSFSSAWLGFWTGGRKRVGYATDTRGWLLTQALAWTDSMRHVARPQVYLNLARQAGADVDLCEQWNFTLRVSNEELSRADALLQPSSPGRLVGLAPGSVAKSRRWPIDRYAQLADRLTAQKHRVVLLGSRSDQEVARSVERRAKGPVINLAGKTSLRDAMAVIRRLDLLVSNDSGAMHLAYAQHVPVLVLQGAADPRATGPFANNSAVLRDEDLSCAPCVQNECGPKHLKCMKNLALDRVWDQVRAQIAKLPPKK